MMGPRVIAGVVLLFVFAVGMFAGVAFERHHIIPGSSAMSSSSSTMSAAEEHAAAIAELREVAGLDDHQVAQIHSILAERQQLVEQMWEQLRPEVQGAMRDVHEEIAAILRPDQQKRFQDWIMRHLEDSQALHH